MDSNGNERQDNISIVPAGVVDKVHRRRKSMTEVLRPDLVEKKQPSLCEKCGMIPPLKCDCGFAAYCKPCKRQHHKCQEPQALPPPIASQIAKANFQIDIQEQEARQREEDHRLEMSAIKVRYELLLEQTKDEYSRKLKERDEQIQRYQFLLDTINQQKADLNDSLQKNEKYSTAKISELKQQIAEYEAKIAESQITQDDTPPPLIRQESKRGSQITKPGPPVGRVRKTSSSLVIKEGKLVPRA